MPIYTLADSSMKELKRTTLAEPGNRRAQKPAGSHPRQIGAIAPDTLVIGEEFSEWAGSARRIDLLGVSRDASLVVVELKRTETGEHMELQALRYAAMVSTLTYSRAVEFYSNYLRKHGFERYAERDLLDFFGWDEPRESEFAQDVRIVLASADFSQELTTTVLWLIDRDIDIRCVRLIPYSFGDQVLLDVQQLIPVPEAEAYQVKIREQSEERRARSGMRSATVPARRFFWAELLERARSKAGLHANISPSRDTWLQTGSGIGGVAYRYGIRQHACSISLAIERKDPSDNRRIFQQLLEKREEIEGSFGETLSGIRTRRAAAVTCDCPGGFPGTRLLRARRSGSAFCSPKGRRV